ncbi:MAG: glutathione S-transferase family protein [Silicimonas sp.]|nr:glutathione S-transferase family protein [Silicimonas sp.]
MGQLIDGVWHDTETKEVKKDGQFVRNASAFRNWVTPSGTPGPSGSGGFKAEAGRYHLYVSYACPWAHRAMIYLSVLGLKHVIDVSVVHPVNLENGWEFADYPGATADRIGDARYLYEVYVRSDPTYTGKVTVPILWDKETGTIVNNESSEVMRMLGGEAFQPLAQSWADFYPPEHQGEIDKLNDLIYGAINNGVYRTGFSQSQEAYETGVTAMFEAFDWLDERLGQSRFLCGDRPVESDWRLFTSMIRFEPVYYFHFKCNVRQLTDYPNLRRHTRDVLNQPGVRETVHADHIVDHYYLAHRRINPYGIIPAGAAVDYDGPNWSAPHIEEKKAC